MHALIDDRFRQVVPRWRLFQESMRRDELSQSNSSVAPKFTELDIKSQLEDWRRHKTLSVAGDLVSVALTLGVKGIADDAARFIETHVSAPQAAQRAGRCYLYGRDSTEDVTDDPLCDDLFEGSCQGVSPFDFQFRLQLRNIKRDLAFYPRNPIQWCNLSLLYTFFGVRQRAERAMAIALAMAPSNRFVLRSASRFFLHQGDVEKAHWILASSPTLKSDPWILAAEIATADSLKHPSRWIKFGRKVVDSGRFPPFHVSELASALGTIELKAGKSKAGRNNVATSLLSPSENAVAQAAWIHRNLVSIDVPHIELSPEAAAFDAIVDRRWDASLENAQKWLRDQPFSTKPATHASFIASIIHEAFADAKTFAAIGLRSNPDEFNLVNNFVFAAVMLGEVDNAEERFRRVNPSSLRPPERVVYLATSGLIAFRRRNPELGRELYRMATVLACRIGDRVRESLARINWAIEESHAGTPKSTELLAEAKLLADGFDPIFGNVLREQVERRLAAVALQTPASTD